MNHLFEESLADNAPAEREMQLAVDVYSDDDAYIITCFGTRSEKRWSEYRNLEQYGQYPGEFKASADENKSLIIWIAGGFI